MRQGHIYIYVRNTKAGKLHLELFPEFLLYTKKYLICRHKEEQNRTQLEIFFFGCFSANEAFHNPTHFWHRKWKRAEKRTRDEWAQRGDGWKEKEDIKGEMEVCYWAARLSEIRKQTFLFLACRSHEGTVHLLPFVSDKSSFTEPHWLSQDLFFFILHFLWHQRF